MTTDHDTELTLILRSPDAYGAYTKGFGRALAGGASINDAAARCDLSADELAGALGVLRRARQSARGATRLATKGSRSLVRLHPMKLSAEAAKLTGRGLALATGPIRRRIFRAFFGKLTSRRARFLAWRSRQSLQPTPAEHARARAWSVAYVKRRGIFGKLVGATLAGDAAIGEPTSTALVTASIPILVQLARRALAAAEKQGAPADPRAADVPPSADQPADE